MSLLQVKFIKFQVQIVHSIGLCFGWISRLSENFYRFPVKLKLEKSFLESKGVQIPLKPGMAITTNLKLRDKRVISLVNDLLVDQTDSVRSIRQQWVIVLF